MSGDGRGRTPARRAALLATIGVASLLAPALVLTAPAGASYRAGGSYGGGSYGGGSYGGTGGGSLGSCDDTYVPDCCNLVVSTSLVQPGQTFLVGGYGFASGTKVTIHLVQGDEHLGTATAKHGGSFVGHVTLPGHLRRGTFTVIATGTGGHGGRLTERVTLNVR